MPQMGRWSALSVDEKKYIFSAEIGEQWIAIAAAAAVGSAIIIMILINIKYVVAIKSLCERSYNNVLQLQIACILE